jgi:DeoR/GlpR family transcriptional regulator of sugar metabolism
MNSSRPDPASVRRQKIAEYISLEGNATFAALADRFGVSQMTVYRDAQELEARGVVRRTRGGLTMQPSSVFESNVRYRASVHQKQKHAIAICGVELVEPGMSVMLDDGTTLMPMAPLLAERAPLTVITNCVPMMTALSEAAGIQLIMLGGTYQQRHDCVSGLLCIDMINQLRADLLFLSPSAVADGQVLHQEQDMVATKRAMMCAAERKVLMVDRSKLGRRALHRVAAVEDFDQIVTDDSGSGADLDHISDRGVPIAIARTDGPAR